MATQPEIDAGAAAFKAWLDNLLVEEGKGWAEMFIPDDAYPEAVQCVISAADGQKDQSPASRQTAGATALRNAVNAAGEGSQVTDEQVAEAAVVILSTVANLRKGSK